MSNAAVLPRYRPDARADRGPLLVAAGVGLVENEKNITFCNTGHWSSIAWFGLSEVLGNKNTTMYDGSMAEWAADPARPIQVQ